MSRDTFVENIGEIVIRKDEGFWILPVIYVANQDLVINSPLFSYLGEKWRFVMMTDWSRDNRMILYLWRKFHSDLPDNGHLVELGIYGLNNTTIGECYNKGPLYSDYGFKAVFGSRSQYTGIRGLIKICFRITGMSNSGAVPLSTGTSDEKNNKKDTGKQNEIDNEGEITSDEKKSDLYEDKGILNEERNKDDIRKKDESNNEDESRSEDEISSDEENKEKNNVSSKVKGIKLLSENLKQVLIDERMTDAVLKVDNREFKVHKIILVARSPVFASMFEHDMAEKKYNEVEIPDCTAEAFQVFLHYLYSGSVEALSASNIYNVYYAADKYRVDELKEKCVKYMIKNISVETFCDVIALSLRHSESKLQKTATDFFCENIKKIIKTVQWQKYMDKNSTQANELFIKALNA